MRAIVRYRRRPRSTMPITRSLTRLMLVLAVSGLLFGCIVSVIKGDAGGVRTAIGNASAPWLLLALLAGLVTGGRPVAGSAAGTTATFGALLGFYVSNSLVLNLGHHAWLVDVELTVRAGARYFALGLLSGPVLGAAGAALRPRLGLLPFVAGVLLIGEPLAWIGYETLSSARFSGQAPVFCAEAAIGFAALLFGRRAVRVRL